MYRSVQLKCGVSSGLVSNQGQSLTLSVPWAILGEFRTFKSESINLSFDVLGEMQ
jgi:hypothetical protein